MKYEIREIDAWKYDDCWTWNTSYLMGEMNTIAKNEKRAFIRWLKRYHNIVFKKNRIVIDYDGSIYEILDRKTKEPLFAAIPKEEV